MTRFRDRIDAGERLAEAVCRLPSLEDVVVLGVARGGVPVAAVVAKMLAAPLDTIVVRKLGVPGHEELAMGAIGESGLCTLNDDVIAAAGLGHAELGAATRRARSEISALAERLREGRPPIALRGKQAVVVDDGIATGATARVACLGARVAGATRVVLAAPVVAAPAANALHDVADDLVFLVVPKDFEAVGMWYHHFASTPEAQVKALLSAQRAGTARPAATPPEGGTDPYEVAEGSLAHGMLVRTAGTRPWRGR